MNRLRAFENVWLILANSRQWLLVVLGLLGSSAAHAQQFPYLAYVTAEQSYVRSGPGQRYYPTARLPEGFAVEVYRHDGEGWCAIRPPEGSFSWVPSHQVRTVDAGVVEVIGDHVVTRVGSTLSPNRSAVQVLLPQGERVQLIAAANADADDPRWVRVAAPAGEFRWIAAEAVSLQPPLEAIPLPKSLPHATPQSAESGWSRQSEYLQNPTAGEPNAFDHLNQAAVAAPTGLQFEPPADIAVSNLVPAVERDPNAMDVVAGSPAELQLAQFQARSADQQPPASLPGSDPTAMQTLASAHAALPRVRFRGLTPASPGTIGTVEELELRLSQAVVEPPQQWKLEPIEAAAHSLLAATNTPPVRAQLREVLERIARFQQVQQRYNDPVPAASPSLDELDPFPTTELVTEAGIDVGTAMRTEAGDPKRGALTGIASSIRERAKRDLDNKPAPPSGRRMSSTDKPLYDATGLLKPVVSKREQAPQYALVDEQGKVVSFVTPTPDLNLTPYIGRRIGVHGTRGFMPEYRRAHVTAGRVTPIEGTIRR